MTINSSTNVAPFASFVVVESTSPFTRSKLQTLLDRIGQWLPEAPIVEANQIRRAQRTVSSSARVTKSDDGTGFCGKLIHSTRKVPNWLPRDVRVGGSADDVENHLVATVARDKIVCIFLSDSDLRTEMVRWLRGNSSYKALAPAVALLPPGRLSARLDSVARLRALWLKGLHRSVSTKPDAKVLLGNDLSQTLDPIGDQTYFYTSARAQVPWNTDHIGIGVTPRESRVWLSKTNSWDAFQVAAMQVIEILGSGSTSNPPLGTLATPLTRKADAKDPFDVSVSHPDYMGRDDPPSTDPEWKWSEHSTFELLSNTKDSLKVVATIGTEKSCKIELRVNLDDWGAAELNASCSAGTTCSNDLCGEARSRLTNTAWTTIRYGSGHTVADGLCFFIAFRDQPFLHFKARDIDSDSRRKEKPGVGTKFDRTNFPGTSKSLFRWLALHLIQSNPDGWITCDDDSGEIADFVEYHPGNGGPPRIVMYHCKAKNVSKKVSVGDYEDVASQALKNIRYLDPDLLCERLHERSFLANGNKHANLLNKLVWHKQAQYNTRDHMIAAIKANGHNVEKRVVLVAPSLDIARINALRSLGPSPTKSDRDAARRLPLLDALLIDTQIAFNRAGAEFEVWTAPR